MSQIEAKAYKRLYGLYKSTLLSIINKARNAVEYYSDNPDRMKEMMGYIADEKQWNYCGIENKVDTKIIDELEKLLPDEQ